MKNADSYCFQKVLSDKDLHCFLGFLALIRVNLRNPWLMTCSTIVEDPLQIGPSFFKTNPIFLRTRIIASSVLTKGYQRIAACGDQKGKAKQSQLPTFWREARSTKCDNSGAFSGCLLPGVAPEILNKPNGTAHKDDVASYRARTGQVPACSLANASQIFGLVMRFQNFS